jgi:AcrR family transcriptional regulator
MKARPYVMKARADAAHATHQRILHAGAALLWEKLSPEITLDEVAERAEVSVRTLLRHFGTRERLLAEVESFLHQEAVQERQAPAGDVQAAVRVIFDHYELRGDAVLRLLAQEAWNDHIRAAMDSGRAIHREWVEQVFAPQLAEYQETERDLLTDLLVVAMDVYTWKLLRRDRALGREQAEERVRRLIAAILARQERI